MTLPGDVLAANLRLIPTVIVPSRREAGETLISINLVVIMLNDVKVSMSQTHLLQ